MKSFGFFAFKGDVVFSYLAVSCDILVSSCKPYVILPNKSSKYIQLNHSLDKENKLLCLVNCKHIHDLVKKSTYLSFSITGRERLIRSHSLARFCFELRRNSN